MDNPTALVKLRPIILAIATACILAFLVAPLVVAVAVLIVARPGVSVPVALGAVAFVTIVGYAMSSSLQWVELDGDVIRGRRLLTRKIVVYRVGDIVDAKPIHTDYLGKLENAVLDFLLDTSNRGYQLFFRDGSRIPLIRADMSGVDAFLAALAAALERDRLGRRDAG
jgi:hypothetical protein